LEKKKPDKAWRRRMEGNCDLDGKKHEGT